MDGKISLKQKKKQWSGGTKELDRSIKLFYIFNMKADYKNTKVGDKLKRRSPDKTLWHYFSGRTIKFRVWDRDKNIFLRGDPDGDFINDLKYNELKSFTEFICDIVLDCDVEINDMNAPC